MNSLQIELDSINQKLELLNFRKAQLDSIRVEYSDVINRVKNLIDSMEDANIEPSNLLLEIEGIVHGVEPTPKPEQTTEIPQTAPLTPEPTPEPDDDNDYEYDGDESEPTSEPQQHFDFNISLFPKTNSLGLPVSTPKQTSTPEQSTERKFFPPKCFWDYGTSLRLFINKKRRGKGEIEAIFNDCLDQGLCERYDLNECGDDWIVALSPVTSEDTVNRIIGEFYPKHTDVEPAPKSSNPELVKLMALVPTVVAPEPTPEPTPTPKPTTKTQLNERAWRRDDTLLIGFTNKKLMNTWAKWARESWADRINITNYETLENFDHCLSILWYNRTDWERLKALDYSLKPDEQKTIKTENFEYKQANEKTTQIFRDGVLLGLAKDCGSHWESPQFKDEQFENREAIAVKLWELINNF